MATRVAYNNIFETSKAYSNAVDQRLSKRIDALEKSIKDLRNLWERKLASMQVSQKRQLDTVERNEKKFLTIINVQQQQLVYLTKQNEELMLNYRDISKLLDNIVTIYNNRVKQLEDKIEMLTLGE
jgi:uncharacterized Ntn-hydrolase superfamily protein